MRTRIGLLMVAIVIVAGFGFRAFAQQEDGFPHEVHARLFPTCIGCHAGADTGDDSDLYPSPELCLRCHDGVRRQRVAWSGTVPEPDNLRFDHARHQLYLPTGDDMACLRCHGAGEQPAWMEVRGTRPAQCLSCHAHRAPSHLAEETPCMDCHVPVAEARGLPVEEIASFPMPASHRDPGFILEHGPTPERALARCAVCHAQESCERCHLNAATVPAIAALARDERLALVVRDKEPEYPLPPSHRQEDWLFDHGLPARADIQQCANCHTQPSCETCHIGTGATLVIAQLPMPRPGGPAGVAITGRLVAGALEGFGGPARSGAGLTDGLPTVATRAATSAVHPVGFATEHAAAAATNQPQCSICHTQRFCTDCHDGPSRPRFHPVNYVARHATDAYGEATDCASCHNTEVFCRGCHAEAGLASVGRLDVAFHTAAPLWLLQHGEPARQGLRSCTTCHRQSDCMQCHSELGLGINPHGPDFDARRMADRNRIICQRCHIGDPFAP